jgi:hypothetical protein
MSLGNTQCCQMTTVPAEGSEERRVAEGRRRA